jgi:hypothetical protein
VPNVPLAWKSLWAQLMVLLGDMCQVKTRFGLFGDSVNLGARSVHGFAECSMSMEIFSGALDATSMRYWSSGSSFRSVWTLY